MKMDPAVLRVLSLSPSKTTVSSHGGSGFTTTAKITTCSEDGNNKCYFLKTSQAKDASTMFTGEHASLNAIHAVVPSLCPRSYGCGSLDEAGEQGAFLVTDFLDMGMTSLASPRDQISTERQSLAQKLAKLHTTPAPPPKGFDKAIFGFPVSTCCGDTVQDNTFNASWADFFSQRRLMSILRAAEKSNGPDKQLRNLVERVVGEVVPRLIGDKHLNDGEGVTPVVVHGDLWSGNKGQGQIGAGAAEDVIFDPSACYAHSEYELGIMKMFGGFDSSFMRTYHRMCPKTRPVDEYEDRIALYEAYHYMNHFTIFGGGYRSGAVSIFQTLLRKYGRKSEI